MVVTPTWLGATAGFSGVAGQANQFLGTHAAQFVYSGTLREGQSTGSSVYSSSQSTWLSQEFTTASTQTSISYLQLQISTVGGSPTLQLINPLIVSLYADSLGFPTGSPLITTTVSSQQVYNSGFWLVVPMPITSLTGLTNYHIVTQAVGTATHYYTWQQAVSGTGAATSSDGVSWTAQSYGFMYQVYDQSGTLGSKVNAVIEDNGARLTQFTYNANGTLATTNEYNVAQGTNTYLSQNRTFTYTNGLLTGVS